MKGQLGDHPVEDREGARQFHPRQVAVNEPRCSHWSNLPPPSRRGGDPDRRADVVLGVNEAGEQIADTASDGDDGDHEPLVALDRRERAGDLLAQAVLRLLRRSPAPLLHWGEAVRSLRCRGVRGGWDEIGGHEFYVFVELRP